MDRSITLINGQPVARDIKEIATDDNGVNTAIVAFLEPGYVRRSEQDTAIRAPLARASEAPTEIDSD